MTVDNIAYQGIMAIKVNIRASLSVPTSIQHDEEYLSLPNGTCSVSRGKVATVSSTMK